ncbi:hypothetical protein SASPL_100496 [Salvia splendens]|uniref:Uncharacterized protein n=1 Tax=Salvia splendens TaxID=180675 RepID=A0A8X8YS91_SALSN|nr:uncharacterized protein LOC121757724 [Salvia splendens]KAG6435622.1 hypothetical protein SASPL_100496 [Salvia splendens]
MASSAPSKSQPLHNFELPPLLKWSKDGKSSGSQKRRRSLMSPPQRSSAASGSPIHRDYAAAASPRDRSPPPPSPEYPVVAGGDSVKHTSVCDRIQHLAIGADSEKLRSRGGDWSTEPEASRKGKELGKKSNASAIRKCNLQIKIGSKSSKEEEDLPKANNKEEGEIDNAGKANQKADDEARPWNLRPRNAKTKIDKEVYGGERSKAESLRRGGKEGKGEEREKGEKKKNKMSINISLTKEEIEEDIFAMTGAKPSRRPQRRPKNVQKQLDLTFPGLHLRSITPDSY